MKPQLIFPLLALTLFAACSNDDESAPASRAELLTSRTWKLTAQHVNPALTMNGETTHDIYKDPHGLVCYRDNTYKYSLSGDAAVGGNVLMNEGDSICTSADTQTQTWQWLFNQEQTKITEIEDNGPQEFTILELTTTTFKRSSTTVVNGVTHTYTDTYTAL